MKMPFMTIFWNSSEALLRETQFIMKPFQFLFTASIQTVTKWQEFLRCIIQAAIIYFLMQKEKQRITFEMKFALINRISTLKYIAS